ncbi:MAG: hypothetical protein WHT27_03860 [candidate division WOR-3 bacterium]
MKKITILILVFVLVFNISVFSQNLQQQKPSYEEGKEAGRIAASSENTFLWGILGCGATSFLSLFGCLGTTIVAYLIEPQIPYIPYEKGDNYRIGFKEGYSTEIRMKRAISTLVGGSIPLICITAFSISYYLLYGTCIFTSYLSVLLASIFSMQ